MHNSNQKENETIQEITKSSDTPTYTFKTDTSTELKKARAELNIPKEFVPDLRNLRHNQDGFATEIGTSDAEQIKKAVEAARKKEIIKDDVPAAGVSISKSARKKQHQPPVINTIAGYRIARPFPDDSRIGWTSFSNLVNPGGPLNVLALEKNKTTIDPDLDLLFNRLVLPFSEGDWQDFGIVFMIGIGFWLLAKIGAGIGVIILVLCTTASYFRLSYRRFATRTKDDIKREFVNIMLAASDTEKVNWLNNFIERFWLIFEPVISAFVIENIDTYIVDYLPGFLNSARLVTFTLGSKPFRVDCIKTFTDTDPDTVCMDWSFSFKPDSTENMTKKQIDKQVSPKVVMSIRLGKGFVGTAFSVLLEDVSFQGRLRIKIKFMSKMPHIKLVEVCFMEKPTFNYVLKPMGGETFGFDVNNIPGLQGFVREQTHAVLGPMMYYPNTFSFDFAKFFSGEMDISQANGVLAITIHSCSQIPASSDALNPFVRLYLDEAQELEKTSVCENTRKPHWNETKFILLNNLDSILTFELRTTNNTRKSGKKVARAPFDLNDVKASDENELNNLELTMLRRGKFVTTLSADVKYFPVSKPIENPDGSFIEAASSNSGVLRVTIHECKNLPGKVNPYANISVNGVERFKTPTFKRTSNPKFERSYEILVLDRTEVRLSVTVHDSVDFAANTELGTWNAYLLDIMHNQEEKEYWWELQRDRHETGARLRFSVQWKPVVMDGLSKMGAVGGTLYTPPIGVVRFSIWSASNLSVGNRQESYVRIKSGKQTRARTEIAEHMGCAEWGEFYYVPVHSDHEDLVLEVINWNNRSKDKSLGSCVFEMKKLIVKLKDEESDTVYYDTIHKKIDRNDPLINATSTQKSHLKYTVEFYPTVALAGLPDEEESDDQKQPFDSPNLASKKIKYKEPVVPAFDLHKLPIRYTPDNIIDFSSYDSGVLTVKIHEVMTSQAIECCCQVMVDSLTPQYRTNTLKGRVLTFNETSDAFIKDVGFSRIAIQLKPADKSEKDDVLYGYWFENSEHIMRNVQKRARQRLAEKESNATAADFDYSKTLVHSKDDEGEWFDLLSPVGGPAKIRLSFGYSPLLNYKVNPDESIENQGNLTVTLLSAKNLKAVDKSGTSDPFVKFIINGELVHKSQVIKKNLNPVWKGEKFETSIVSRVTASFRIEVFDWNQISGNVPIGSGGITLRGDMVESFVAHERDIPLDGSAGVTGSVRVRLKWEPQLLLRKKAHTTFMGGTRKMTTRMGTTAFDFSQPPRSNTGLSFASSTSSGSTRVLPESNNTHKSDINTTKSIPSNIQEKQQFLYNTVSSSSIKSNNNVLKENNADVTRNIICPGIVTIIIMEAKGLRGEKEKLNPVVVASLNKHQLLKCKAKKTSKPSWNGSFFQHCDGSEMKLEISVGDARTFHTSEIGTLKTSLWDLIRPPLVTTFDKWLPLEPNGSGEIHVKIHYVADTK